MGILSKLWGGVERTYQAAEDAEHAVFRDRHFERAEQLAADGLAVEGTVTGVHAKLDDSFTKTHYRVEWSDPARRAAGISFTTNTPSVLRLGSTVPLRVAGDKAALDVAALAGLSAAQSAQSQTLDRSAPEPGVSDTSLNWSVLRDLKKGTTEPGRIVGFDRVTVLGMRTENWDITITRPDGTSVTVHRAEVPAYVRWFVAPGAQVPLTVEPEHPDRTQIHWVVLARERSGGSWRDVMPPDSIAAAALAPAEAVTATSMGAETEVTLTPSAESAAAIEGVTIERWGAIEAGLQQHRVPPADYDAFATEHHAVPAGRWTAIKGQWETRMRTDWRVGAAFGAAFEAARKDLKKRR